MFFSPSHAPQCHVEEKGLPGELRLLWAHRIWVEECVLAQEGNLPRVLSYQPFFRIIFGHFCSSSKLFDGGDAFPITLWAAVDFWKLGVHVILKMWKKIDRNGFCSLERSGGNEKSFSRLYGWLTSAAGDFITIKRQCIRLQERRCEQKSVRLVFAEHWAGRS